MDTEPGTMQAVIFIGIQGSGKSSFYKARFFTTHIRLSLDMLRTRYREKIMLTACLEGKQPFVIDNTNPTIAERAGYIELSKSHGFRVDGYYFRSELNDALERNRHREGRERIPDKGVLGTYRKLQIPEISEGFDALHCVTMDKDYHFVIED